MAKSRSSVQSARLKSRRLKIAFPITLRGRADVNALEAQSGRLAVFVSGSFEPEPGGGNHSMHSAVFPSIECFGAAQDVREIRS
jgi:hypothetical protein